MQSHGTSCSGRTVQGMEQFHICARHCIQINTSSDMTVSIFPASPLAQAWGGSIATRSWIFLWNLHRSQSLYDSPAHLYLPDTAVSQIKDDHSGVHTRNGCQIHFEEHSLRQTQKHKQLLELSAPIHWRRNWQYLSLLSTVPHKHINADKQKTSDAGNHSIRGI